jgi:hypothetical protein
MTRKLAEVNGGTSRLIKHSMTTAAEEEGTEAGTLMVEVDFAEPAAVVMVMVEVVVAVVPGEVQEAIFEGVVAVATSNGCSNQQR